MWSSSENMARSWDKNLGRRERRYHHVRPPLIIGLAPGRPVGLTLRMLGVITTRGVLQYILVSQVVVKDMVAVPSVPRRGRV